MTQPLTREVLSKCVMKINEYQNTQKVRSTSITVYNHAPEEVRRALIMIFGDDVWKRKDGERS